MALSINEDFRKILGYTTNGYATVKSSLGYPLFDTAGTTWHDFIIFGGTRPDRETIRLNPTVYTYNSADSLIYWSGSVATNTAYNHTVNATGDGVLLDQNAFTAHEASKTGTGTWFLLARRSSSTYNSGFWSFVTGTVGTTGSGSDIELTDVNFIQGDPTLYSLDTDVEIKFGSIV